MNRELVEQTLNLLKSMPEHFTMGDFWVESDVKDDSVMCGTAGCLAYYAIHAAGDWERVRESFIPIQAHAGELLGLEPEISNYWFFGLWSGKNLFDIEVDDVIQFLEEVLRTGDPRIWMD